MKTVRSFLCTPKGTRKWPINSCFYNIAPRVLSFPHFKDEKKRILGRRLLFLRHHRISVKNSKGTDYHYFKLLQNSVTS